MSKKLVYICTSRICLYQRKMNEISVLPRFMKEWQSRLCVLLFYNSGDVREVNNLKSIK